MNSKVCHRSTFVSTCWGRFYSHSPPFCDLCSDGLYVLLRPYKKPKSGTPAEVPKAPAHLEHLVIRSPPSETCPWSLSGPQFPQPTAIQQRYCYPKGPHEYSSRVGGALWTMYGTNGKEDLEFRLLHVYYSAKRAVNKGVVPPTSPPKAMRTPSPQRRIRGWQLSSLKSHQGATTPTSEAMTHPGQTHMSTTAAFSSSGICHSPLSFDWSSVASPTASTPLHHRDNVDSANWLVTPVSDLFRRRGRPSPSSNTTLTSPINRKRSREESQEELTPDTAFTAQKSTDTLDESAIQELDYSYWNDPLMNILMQPSHDAHNVNCASSSAGTRSLPQRLTMLHEKLREVVGNDTEAATVVKEWAECLASEFKGKMPC